MKIRHEVPYGDYLNLDRILSAQNPPAPDGEPRELHHHDEMLFIVIHQVYELWFKQVFHEMTYVRDLLDQPDVPEAAVPRIVKALNRVQEIFSRYIQKLELAIKEFGEHQLHFRG